MTNPKLRKLKTKEDFELDIKRLYVPYTIDFICSCGEFIKHDLSHSNYLSYPKLNEPEKLILWCQHCDTEHTIFIKVDLNIEIVSGENNT